ncbi:hypothetical protein C8Q74DRAFT_1409132 [Fomes fomentarius]|nr:hypothetical protein C8Q74DRAFT_1409132 [Fomes fomentarius]
MSPPSIFKLDNDNYAEWALAMEALLTRRGLWEVTSEDANYTRPTGSDASKPSTDANTIWITLKDVHQARGFGTRVARRRAFWRMAKHTDQSMSAWIADVRHAAFNLENISATITDEDVILVLTNGLPTSYSQLIVTLDATPPSVALTVETVIKRLLNEESRQSTEPLAPVAPAACFNKEGGGELDDEIRVKGSANERARRRRDERIALAGKRERERSPTFINCILQRAPLLHLAMRAPRKSRSPIDLVHCHPEQLHDLSIYTITTTATIPLRGSLPL